MKKILILFCIISVIISMPLIAYADNNVGSNMNIEISFYSEDDVMLDQMVINFTQINNSIEYSIRDSFYYFVIDEVVFSEDPEVIINRGDEVINIGEKYEINSQPIYFNDTNVLYLKATEYSLGNELTVNYSSKNNENIIDSNTFDALEFDQYTISYPSTATSIELIVDYSDSVIGVSLNGEPGVEADFGYLCEISCANDITYKLIINLNDGQVVTDIKLEQNQLSAEKELKRLKIDCFSETDQYLESKTLDNISNNGISVEQGISKVIISVECSEYAKWETNKPNNIVYVPDEFVITITAEDGSKKDYSFSINIINSSPERTNTADSVNETSTEATETNNSRFSWTWVLIIGGVVLLIAVVIIIIRRYLGY